MLYVSSSMCDCMCDLQEAQSCSIPLSLHLEIEWTKYGSLVNPQAQIVSIKEVIQTNTTSLVRLTFSEIPAGHLQVLTEK